MQLLAIGATGPIYSLQYAHCNQSKRNSVKYIKEEVEQDFLEKLFDTFGRLICVPQEQFPSLSFKNKAV